MATLKASVLAILNDDVALSGIITGGVFDADSLPNGGLTVATIAKESNGVTIQPTGVLRWRERNPVRGISYAARQFVEIYLYDDPSHGRDNIDYGKRRIWELLNKRWVTNTDHERMAYLVWAGDLGELPEGRRDDVLMASMGRSRYLVDLTRKTT
jgi:hypothetical protein